MFCAGSAIVSWPGIPPLVLLKKIDDTAARWRGRSAGEFLLTSRAMESNFGCGILIRGGPQPCAIRDHVDGPYTAGFLCQL